jgi:3-oxoacyl-[acyl-carrier-protein] synthase-1
MEWGVAQVRLGPRLRADDLRVPAMSLGDTGAASGGVSVVFGAHLFSRGLAREALVLSSSERGETGCIGMHIEDDADPEGA